MTAARVARRFASVALLVGIALVAFAAPASAHGIGGTAPTNYDSTVTRITPATRGVSAETIDLGNRLRVANHSNRDLVVLGYDDEPYLRIGPRGVFENRRSPATYLNRSLTVTTRVPDRADSKAPPEWDQVSSGQIATWHDHRAHFMGTEAPPVVKRAPDQRHVLDRWVVPLRIGSESVDLHGTLSWVPPPSPWPSVVLAVLVAAAVIGLGRTRHWRSVLAIGTAALVVCAVLHAVGNWAESSASFGSKSGESIYSIVGIALGVLALVWMWRRGADAAVPFVLVAAVFLLVAGGLADLATLGHSQVPSSLPAVVDRIVVALTIGLGVGLAATAGLRLRVISPDRHQSSSAQPS
ncbi:MAG: hypothetical protein ABW211_01160 [Acidimicrobiia bacterium]